MANEAQQESSNEKPQVFTELSRALVSAREQKKLSVEDVAEQLKIAASHIQYFEGDDLDLTQLDPFQRGYLRNYSELLNVDISPYKTVFPEVVEVGSSLQSVDLEEHATKPIISIAMMRIFSTIAVIGIIILLIAINV